MGWKSQPCWLTALLTTPAAMLGTTTCVCALTGQPRGAPARGGGRQPRGAPPEGKILLSRALFLSLESTCLPPLAFPGRTGLTHLTPSPADRPLSEVLDGPRSPPLLFQPEVGRLVPGLHHPRHGQLLLHRCEPPCARPSRPHPTSPEGRLSPPCLKRGRLFPPASSCLALRLPGAGGSPYPSCRGTPALSIGPAGPGTVVMTTTV